MDGWMCCCWLWCDVFGQWVKSRELIGPETEGCIVWCVLSLLLSPSISRFVSLLLLVWHKTSYTVNTRRDKHCIYFVCLHFVWMLRVYVCLPGHIKYFVVYVFRVAINYYFHHYYYFIITLWVVFKYWKNIVKMFRTSFQITKMAS